MCMFGTLWHHPQHFRHTTTFPFLSFKHRAYLRFHTLVVRPLSRLKRFPYDPIRTLFLGQSIPTFHLQKWSHPELQRLVHWNITFCCLYHWFCRKNCIKLVSPQSNWRSLRRLSYPTSVCVLWWLFHNPIHFRHTTNTTFCLSCQGHSLRSHKHVVRPLSRPKHDGL